MVSVSVRYLFYQPMDEKIKIWPLRFPAKENPNIEKALFYWPLVLQYDVKASYRLISRKFSGMEIFHPSGRLTNRNPRAFVSVRWTYQIALFPFVCCLCFVPAFLFQGHTKIARKEYSCTKSEIVKNFVHKPGVVVKFARLILTCVMGSCLNGDSMFFSWMF